MFSKIDILSTKKTLFLFALILLASLIFRVTNLNLIEFKTDEAVNLLLASRPLFGHSFAPGGTVSSIGILNPPLFTYLLFPLTAVSMDPRWLSFAIGLINSIAIAFLFLILKKYYNQTIAFISTLLMAFSPWAIIYSRKIWTQDLLVPFFIPFFWSYNKLLVEKKQVFWVPYSIFALFLIQLHQISLIFVSIFTIFLLTQKIKLNFKYILIGSFIGILPFIPFVFFELNNNCPDCKAFLDARTKLSSQRSVEVFMRPFQIASQGDFRFILGNDTLTFSKTFNFTDKLRKVFYIEYLLIPIGIIIFFKKYKKFSSLIYTVIILPIIYYLLKIEPFMHYYIIILPLLFLFLGTSFDFFLKKKNLLFKISSLVILTLIIIESISFDYSFFKLLKTKGAVDGDYGSTYYSSNKENEKNLSTLKNRPDYQEIKLFNYIPYSELFGYLPLSRMLFNYDNKEKRISYLESLWRKNSNDPRIGQELLALNTINPLTKTTVDYLWLKKQSIPQYKKIYEAAKSTYLGQNYKLNYYSNKFNFSLDYPSYWVVKDSKDGIEINVDKYVATIKIVNNLQLINKSRPTIQVINLLEQNIKKETCIENGNWYGTNYYPIKIENNFYILSLTGTEVRDNPEKNMEKNLKELISSIRPY